MTAEKKPIYKRWWFISIGAFLALGILGSVVSGTSPGDRVDKEVTKKSEKAQVASATTPKASAEKPVEQSVQPESASVKEDTKNVTLTQDKDVQKAMDIALKKFQCTPEEVYIEKISSTAILASLVSNEGGGMSTLDSLLIVKGKVKAKLTDDYDKFNELVENAKGNGSTLPATSTAKIDPLKAKWNLIDNDIFSSGNPEVAAKLLIKMSPEEFQQSKWVQDNLLNVYNAPWKYYGQAIAVKGTVASITLHAPGSDISKLVAKGNVCTEVSILPNDQEFGVTFFLIGDGSDIKNNTAVTIFGFPVGQFTGTNQFGGQVTPLVILGIKK